MTKSNTLSFIVQNEDGPPPDPPYISPKWIGINFTAREAAYYQNHETPAPPKDYLYDSMRWLYSSGIRVIRLPVYWESWERNRQDFIIDIAYIINEAGKYGMKVIIDNHHWETGSWLGWGLGFPNSVLGNYQKKEGEPDYNNVKDFWDKFWTRQAKTIDGVDVWDAQYEFLEDIVNLTRHNSAVIGYEILNEPEVWRNEDYPRVAEYHSFMIQRLRELTDKTLVLCWSLARGGTFDSAGLQSMAIPGDISRENLLYDGHAYPPSHLRMGYFSNILSPYAGEIPLWMGEFNSGFTTGATVSREQVFEYVQRFKDRQAHGWQFWRWNYYHDDNVPAFNTAKIENGKIVPNETFWWLAEAIREIKP